MIKHRTRRWNQKQRQAILQRRLAIGSCLGRRSTNSTGEGFDVDDRSEPTKVPNGGFRRGWRVKVRSAKSTKECLLVCDATRAFGFAHQDIEGGRAANNICQLEENRWFCSKGSASTYLRKSYRRIHCRRSRDESVGKRIRAKAIIDLSRGPPMGRPFLSTFNVSTSTSTTGRLSRELWDESQQQTQRARVRGKFNEPPPRIVALSRAQIIGQFSVRLRFPFPQLSRRASARFPGLFLTPFRVCGSIFSSVCTDPNR